MAKTRSEWKGKTSDAKPSKEEIAETFVLHEDNELIGPNLPFYYCRINANKIIDGLFVGNQDAAHDLEFLLSIKCKYVINCAGTSVPNLFSRFGVRYLTFRWFDAKTCTIFDSQGKSCRQIHKFIADALDRGNSVLVHSVYGDSRACLGIAAYLMLHFHWSVKKCLEFVAYKRPETNPKPHFIKQLLKAAKSLHITEAATTTIEDRWCIADHADTEEAVVTNTFLNSHAIRFDGDDIEAVDSLYSARIAASSKKRSLRWNPNLVEIFNDTSSNDASPTFVGSVTHDQNSEKPLTSILKVRPSTPVLPIASSTSLQSAQTSTNYMKIHDNISSHLTKTNPSEPDDRDSALSYLSDTINTLRVGRKSVTNQAFTGFMPSHTEYEQTGHTAISSHASSNRKRTPSLASIHDHEETASTSSHLSQMSALRVIGRSNDAIKASNTFRSSSSAIPQWSAPALNKSKSNSNVSQRVHKSASRKKQRSGSGIRKGPALYGTKSASRHQQASHELNNGVRSHFQSGLSSTAPIVSSGAFPARRLLRMASEDRINSLKSHQFKSRIGANNLSTLTSKSLMSERPRSAPKTRPKKKALSASSINRPRSNSAKPPSKTGSSKNVTHFRRVGW